MWATAHSGDCQGQKAVARQHHHLASMMATWKNKKQQSTSSDGNNINKPQQWWLQNWQHRNHNHDSKQKIKIVTINHQNRSCKSSGSGMSGSAAKGDSTVSSHIGCNSKIWILNVNNQLASSGVGESIANTDSGRSNNKK